MKEIGPIKILKTEYEYHNEKKEYNFIRNYLSNGAYRPNYPVTINGLPPAA